MWRWELSFFLAATLGVAGCALVRDSFAHDALPLSSMGPIAVTPESGVWDDEYGRGTDADNVSFTFTLERLESGLRVRARVRDDHLVTDDCPPGSVSCPSWDDDNLEVFFDGNNDRAPDARAGKGLAYGGEFTLVANGAAQSDFSGQPKGFGKTWRGTVRRAQEPGGAWRLDYELFFSWACLGRSRAPRPEEDVTFGFNICVHDDDDGGRNDRALYWKGNPSRPYRDESQFGTVTLRGIQAKGKRQ